MTDQANAGKVYRQDWRGRAATALSFIVSIVVVIGSYVVVDALNVRTPSGKASILPVTRDVVRASVAAVLDERLSDERLKTMLGVDAAASQQADKKNKLATVAKQQGKAVEAPPPGPDYAVSYFKARSGALADELADGIDASAVERLAPCARNDKKKTSCYVPGIRESELRAIREAIEPGVRSAVAVSEAGNRRPPKRWSAGPTRPRRTAASSASGATGNMPRNRRTSSCVRSISPHSPRRSLGASPRPSTSTRSTPTRRRLTRAGSSRASPGE